MSQRSYISSQRQRHVEDRQRITRLLKLTEEDYFNMVLDYGKRYQEEVMDLDEWGCFILDEYSQYWSWWVNAWMRRDQRFLLLYGKGHASLADLLAQYEAYHDPLRLEEYPNSAVLEVTYEQMISTTLKQVQRERLNQH